MDGLVFITEMNRQDEKKLAKKVIAEILRLKEANDIDFSQMPEPELSRWVGYLVRKSKK